MDKVMCKYCGYEMALVPELVLGPGDPEEPYERWYECRSCGACSPRAISDGAAYEAATRHMPNLPLTKEQIMGMPDDDALWLVEKYDGTIHVQSVFVTDTSRRYPLLELFYVFAAKPTPADIEAARKKG